MAKKYMRMNHQTWMDGRSLKVGDIVELEDDGTAERWAADGLAKASSESAYRNQRQAAADLAEEQAAEASEDAPSAPPAGNFDEMITREDATGSGPPSTRAK